MRSMLAIAVTCSLLAEPAAAVSPERQALGESLIPLIKRCMNIPDGAIEAGATAEISFVLKGGELVGEPKATREPKTRLERAMLGAAIRAVKRCAPYPEAMDIWIDATFDPREPQ